MSFDKKTVYHSQLVAAGTIEAVITGEPTKSKFQKNGEPTKFFLPLKISGNEHQYMIENESIKQHLTGLKGKTVQLTAEGRDTDAEIHVVSANGAPVQPDRNQRTPQRETGPARGRQDSPESGTKSEKEAREFAAFAKAKVYMGRVRVLWQIAAKHADVLFSEVYGSASQMSEAEAADLHMRIAQTLFIEAKGHTEINDLPVKWVDTHSKTDAPKPKPAPPPPPPPPPPEAAPDDDEIPF